MNAPLVHHIAAGRHGFTLAELSITMAIASVAMSMVVRPLQKTLGHERINRAANVVAGDIELAYSLAGRQRRPVRLVFDSAAVTYRLIDRLDGAIYQERPLGRQSEFTLDGASFSPSTIDVFPSGLASGSLTVTLGTGSYTRLVTMTRAGLVRTQ